MCRRWYQNGSSRTEALPAHRADWQLRCQTSHLQNHAVSVILRLRVCGFRETPASVLWYDGVAKRPDTDEDNKDAGDVAEDDTIPILAPYSRRTSALA